MNSCIYRRLLVLSLGLGLLLTPIRAESVLNFPRLSFQENTLTGIAIVNPNSGNALVTITAYGEDGQPLAGITNPVTVTVNGNQQYSKLAVELFGSLDPSTVGWFQARSALDNLTGFFLFLNSTATRFDGADLPESAKKLVFNQVKIGSGFSTELNILNPSSSTATLSLQLISPGSNVVSGSATLPANGVTRLDAGTFFGVTEAASGAYVKVTSDVEVAGFEFVSDGSKDLLGMNARDADEQLNVLYFPQLAVLQGFSTEIGVINYSDQPAILTFSAFKGDGTLFDTANLQNNPVTRSLDAGESLLEDAEQLFGFFGENILDGWVRVESTAEAVNGYVSYGAPSIGSRAAVTSSAVGRKHAIFSHIATIQGFFTGVAILNSGQVATNVRVMAIQKTGDVLGSFTTTMKPGERISKLINELVPEAANQDSGLIWVKSDTPVHLTSLFGTSLILANIPPQAAPASYQPDSGLTTLTVSPTLAVLQPNGTQTFTAGGTSAAVTWKVNGVAGGNETTGTIDASGLYTSPTAVPDPRVLTITAEAENQTAGASVDVLEKSTLLSTQNIVKSVAYLGSLEKIYTAELALLSGLQSRAALAVPAQTGSDSEIFEVSPELVKTSVLSLEGEEISKMIPFRASNGTEFLLLAATTSGKIIRLDPSAKTTTDVVTGLNQPTSLVLDPTTGNLLVAEADKITHIARGKLETGLTSSARTGEESPQPAHAELVSLEGADSVVADACTGDVYATRPATGDLLKYVRATGELQVFANLIAPTRLLALYRAGVSCPDAFQLLVADPDRNEIFLFLPATGVNTVWLGAVQGTDLGFLPGQTEFQANEAVLLAEALEGTTTQQLTGGQVSLVNIPDLYDDEGDNPPDENDIFGPVFFGDPNLEAFLRSLLNLGPTDPITEELLQTITTLNIKEEDITSLEGLEFLTNLTSLEADGNTITDVTPLSQLSSLTTLFLGRVGTDGTITGNAVSDISDLAGLTNLEVFHITDNTISDISVVSNFSKLREFGAAKNSISDASAVSELNNLIFLDMGANNLSDATPFSGLTNLQLLAFSSNSISDISMLSQLNPQVLLMSNNQISDISTLESMTNLAVLSIRGNSVTDLFPLVSNTGLGTGDTVDVRSNPLSSDECTNIITLIDRGVSVSHDLSCQ